MYTDQSRYLAALPSAKTTQELGGLIADLLGQCQLSLRHEGDIEVRNLTVNGTITGGGSAAHNFAVATATWVRVSGHGSSVVCRAASDPIGTLTSDATPFTVYLPRSNAALDPNVYSGDVLEYIELGGVKYAIGETYLDARIGSLKPMTHASPGHGWALCDGSGATDDFTGKFVRGAATYGSTGGADTHGHTGSAGNTSLGITGSIASNTTDIGVEDHPDHAHIPRDTPIVVDEGTDREIYGALPCTSGVYELECGGSALGGQSHTVTDPGHTHGNGTLDITPDPHSHSITIDSGDNVPAYIEVIWFVRVGPSGEIT